MDNKNKQQANDQKKGQEGKDHKQGQQNSNQQGQQKQGGWCPPHNGPKSKCGC